MWLIMPDQILWDFASLYFANVGYKCGKRQEVVLILNNFASRETLGLLADRAEKTLNQCRNCPGDCEISQLLRLCKETER